MGSCECDDRHDGLRFGAPQRLADGSGGVRGAALGKKITRAAQVVNRRSHCTRSVGSTALMGPMEASCYARCRDTAAKAKKPVRCTVEIRRCSTCECNNNMSDMLLRIDCITTMDCLHPISVTPPDDCRVAHQGVVVSVGRRNNHRCRDALCVTRRLATGVAAPAYPLLPPCRRSRPGHLLPRP